MLVRKLLALFKYITKRNFAYLMGIVHTQRLCISFLEPLLIYIFLTFQKVFPIQHLFRDFLALIPQAGGANDHPTFTNFLQFYRMSTYNLLKPPQFGNCSDTKKSQIKKSMRENSGKNRFAY
jgi:hypothetical protein